MKYKYLITFRQDGTERECTVLANTMKDAEDSIIIHIPGFIEFLTCKDITNEKTK